MKPRKPPTATAPPSERPLTTTTKTSLLAALSAMDEKEENDAADDDKFGYSPSFGPASKQVRANIPTGDCLIQVVPIIMSTRSLRFLS